MVLRPIVLPTAAKASTASEPVDAWAAVSSRQLRPADAYWLISQPDHAALSGDLAANFVSPLFPRLDPLVVRSIAVHDSGWALFPTEACPGPPPPVNASGKPVSFVEFAPADFVRAWTASIDRAEAVAVIGGVVVSRHFCGLAQFRLRNAKDAEPDRQRVCQFVERETARQQRLLPHCSVSLDEVKTFVEVLQFCDLLSLFLCSGADEYAEFPQRISSRRVRVSRHDGEDFYRFDPSPFQGDDRTVRPVSLGVNARRYPVQTEPKTTTLPFLLW